MTCRVAAARPMHAGERLYPEKRPERHGPLDRLADWLALRLNDRRHRERRADSAEYRIAIGQTVENLRGAPLAESIATLRYRLRRDGYSEKLIQDCLAHCALGLEQSGLPPPPQVAYLAAREQLCGRLVALGDPAARLSALALAAISASFLGEPVHVIARGPLRLTELADAIDRLAAPLSLRVAVATAEMDLGARRAAHAANIVCTTVQAVGLDYLRDRLQLGDRRGSLVDTALALAGDAPEGGRLVLSGLHWVFIEDADAILIDDARIPLIIAIDQELPGERLLYEQALELARALVVGVHFGFSEHMPVLTDAGRDCLARLIAPLGGVWAAARRREELIGIALRALHEFQRDRDYRVIRGRVEFPAPAGQPEGEQSGGDEMLIRLTEVKEGCVLSGRREILARLSIPGFIARYPHVSGVSESFEGIGGELWSHYAMLPVTVGEPPSPVPANCRLFGSKAFRQAAVLDAVDAAHTAGCAVLIAVNDALDTDFWMRLLSEHGLAPALVRGNGDAADQAAVQELSRPGGLAVAATLSHHAPTQEPAANPLVLLIPELPDSRRRVSRFCHHYAASSAQLLVALDDEMVLPLFAESAAAWLGGRADENGELPPRWSSILLGYAFRMQAREHRIQREELVARDQYLADSLAFAARPE